MESDYSIFYKIREGGTDLYYPSHERTSILARPSPSVTAPLGCRNQAAQRILSLQTSASRGKQPVPCYVRREPGVTSAIFHGK